MHLPSKFKDPVKLQNELKTKSEQYWIKRGERMALRLFHDMARRVPAYKDFLQKKKFSAGSVSTIKDFKKIPLISKDNYLRKYPLEKLCWDGELKKGKWTFSKTSGSTGEPFYFPREVSQDWQYATLAELYLRENFDIHKKSTLYIDAFPMGPWIGGVFTYEAIRLVAERGGYNLSIITTSVNKKEIIDTIKKFGNTFDQILIGCYGPFLKDALDDGTRQGIVWSKYNIGYIFSAEGFNEKFRDYVLDRTQLSKSNIYKTTLNHYGTVDLGTMAHETPLAIMLRRQATQNKQLYRDLFGSNQKLPTLCQYIPELFYFEQVENGLVCSAYSGLPLVRYDLKDHGGVLSLESLKNQLKKDNYNFDKVVRDNEIKNTVWNLPFVYVYERSDFSVSLYAFQIYPETIRKALQHISVEKKLTGKFTMLVRFDKKQNQFLEINVELKGGIKESKILEDKTKKIIVEHLVKDNSEYEKTYLELGKKVAPVIKLWQYEDQMHFKSGGKHKWVKN